MAALAIQIAISAAVSTAAGLVSANLQAEAANKRQDKEVSPAPPYVDPSLVQADPGGPLPCIMGHRKVGGRVILSAKSGDKSYLAIAVAGAPIEAYAGVYIRGALAELDGSGYVVSEPWVSTAGDKALRVILYDGTQTAADSLLLAAFPGWTADHVGAGVPYVVIEMNPNINAGYFAPLFEQTPDFSFDVLGFACYDPRNGACVLGTPSTYVYSDNVSVCRANYFIHPLGMGRPESLIDWASVATSANVDDETVALAAGGTERRYTCAAYWTTGQRHEDVLAKFNAANGGSFAPIGGEWVSTSGAFGVSTATITPDEYEADGLSFSDYAPIGDQVNGVRGTFSSPLHNYDPRDFPAYQDAAALAEDAAAFGVSPDAAATWLDLDLEFVTSPSQAQRLARISYNRARYGHPASLALQFTHFDTVAGDVVTVTDDLAGFAGKTFRVLSDALDANFVVRLTLAHETAAFYAWTAATDERPFDAEAPLLGEPGGLKPPGCAVVDTTVGGVIVANLVLWASPSSGWDKFVVKRGGVTTEFVKGTTVTNFVTVTNVAANTGPWELWVSNSATAEESAKVGTVDFGTVIGGDVIDATEATTTKYVLPTAPAPRLRSAHSGSARLEITASPASRVSHLQLFSNTVNDSGTATLVTDLTNVDQAYYVTGSPGQVRYYWTKCRDTGSTHFGPFSRATVVVF